MPQIREGRQQSLFQCLESDYRLVVHAVNATHSTDFYEVSSLLLISGWNSREFDSIGDIVGYMVV